MTTWPAQAGQPARRRSVRGPTVASHLCPHSRHRQPTRRGDPATICSAVSPPVAGASGSSSAAISGKHAARLFVADLFAVRRADIELFARELENAGRSRATVTRRLPTIAGLYKYAVEENLLDHSPAAHIRRPRLDCECHATGLDRNEVGTLLIADGLGSAAEHALVSLLALNGLRVSEATGADIEMLGTERGHRTLAVTRKGGKRVVIPLAPRTARAIDLAIGERCEGPIFTTASGDLLDRHGAGRIVHRIARRAGQEDRAAHPPPRVHNRCPGRRRPAARCPGGGLPHRSAHHHAVRVPGYPWTGVRPTSSPPTSLEPPDR